MRIQSLSLDDFRNFDSLHMETGPGVNIFYGRNGSGKTNLLEAIFVMLLGRSQRGATDSVMVRDTRDVYRVEGVVANGEDRSVAVAYERGGRKRVRLNEIVIRTAELYEHFAAVAAGPEDTTIVSGSPSVRRYFLDMYLSQYSRDYLATLTDYQKAVSQKNASLKSNMDPSLFDDQIIELGSKLMQARQDFLGACREHAGSHYQQIAGGEPLTVTYTPSVSLQPESEGAAPSIQEAFVYALEECRDRERVMQVSMIGPHRDDFLVEIGGLPARTHGSQGQLRTAAIALKLAVYHILRDRRRYPPILLLDEIFAELDDARTEGLVKAFGDFGQLFLTTALHPPEILVDQARNFRIRSGKVEEMH